MRLLWVATKSPWPPSDGGRLLAAGTIRALGEAGLEVHLLAPYDPAREDAGALAAALAGFCRPHLVAARPRPRWLALLVSALTGQPFSIARHTLPALRRKVARLVSAEVFDVVHAEQLQALPQCAPARVRGLPVVLRAQNVESDLWRAMAASGRRFAVLARREAERLAAWEGRAAREASALVALTAQDALRLGELAGTGPRVHVIPAPFPRELPAGALRLEGDPPVVVFGSRDWFLNQDAARWFVDAVWPRIAQKLPAAVLHVFGLAAGPATTPRVIPHGPPRDGADAFPVGAVFAVPLRFAAGVRMRILEAWARSVPVVATPEAASGLEASAGKELLLARDGEEFAAAVAALRNDAALRARLIAGGHALLARRHDSGGVARQLAGVYSEARSRR